MKPRSFLAALAVCLVALFVAACGDTYIDIGAPTQVVTQTQGGGSGGKDGEQDGTGQGVVTSVKVTQFGEHCPSGTASSGEDRSVRVGCTKWLTCTPFVAPGVEAAPSVHGPTPDFFGVVAGSQHADVTIPSNPFNRDVKGKTPGVISFRCIAKGVQSEQFDLTVVP